MDFLSILSVPQVACSSQIPDLTEAINSLGNKSWFDYFMLFLGVFQAAGALALLWIAINANKLSKGVLVSGLLGDVRSLVADDDLGADDENKQIVALGQAVFGSADAAEIQALLHYAKHIRGS